MIQEVFEIDDHVVVTCSDGAIFQGQLADFTSDYLILATPAGPLGFALDSVEEMRIV